MFSRSSTNGGLEAVISLRVELARGLVLPHKFTAGLGGGTEQHTHMHMHTFTDTHTPTGWVHAHTKNYMLSIRQAVGAITETWQNTMKQALLSEGK